jgi:hypothetical protein
MTAVNDTFVFWTGHNRLARQWFEGLAGARSERLVATSSVQPSGGRQFS